MDTRIDVCICTFRRESIVETLRSLAEQDLPGGLRLRVIVADNDEVPSARERVELAGAELRLDLLYLHCPARNISVARNGAMDAAEAEWIAFIDDDECAEPGWIEALLARVRQGDVDVVLGPVAPVYGPDAPEWMRAAVLHATEPVMRDGTILTGYTSNALLRRRAAGTERFRIDLGRSGGEDTEFFARLHRLGARIGYAPDAVVTEFVPPERARLGWLLRRRYRSGQTHGALLAAEAGPGLKRVPAVLLAAAKAGYSLVCAALSAFNAERRAFWLLRATLHAGVVSRLVGQAEIEQYGLPDIVQASPARPGRRRA